MNSLSVVVITFNEVHRIRECLESVRWCDDIVVVDSGSEDGTLEVCREFTPRTFVRPWQGYASQKNWGREQARAAWVLSLDADERVSPRLQAEIRALDPPDSIDAYWIPRRNYLGDRWMRYGGLYPDLHVRLFRKEGCLFQGDVHEKVVGARQTAVLQGDILHYTYADWGDYLRKIDRYTSLHAAELDRMGVPVRWILLRGIVHFVRACVRQGGWRDGTFGLIYSTLIGLYPIMLYAKLWEKRARDASVNAGSPRSA